MVIDTAIVGGGFSGLMVLYHLAQNARPGDQIFIFEPKERLGPGLAYATKNPHHFLNVPAGNMSALPENQNHFVSWLGINGIKGIAGDYMPRCLYGEYLSDIGHTAFVRAADRGAAARHVRENVIKIEPAAPGEYNIRVANGALYRARRVVLALGNFPPTAKTTTDEKTVNDVWSFDYTTLAGNEGPVLVLGSGLTMVDVLISLRDDGYAGPVTALSRHGFLPHIHDDGPGTVSSTVESLAQNGTGLKTLMRAMRREAKLCAECGISWQRVFDRWRPHLPMLWGNLELKDRRRFFRRLFTLWNIHRHRMAPAIGDFVQQERNSGALRILSSSSTPAALMEGAIRIFDCRGPSYDLSMSTDSLLASLRQSGIITPDPAGWGISIDNESRAVGPFSKSIHVAGPWGIGARLENTAVPELRKQAAQIAADINQNTSH